MTDEDKKPFTVAALGDLHVTETSVHPYRDMFREIAQEADALVLCGDLTHLGRAHEAEILAEDLLACRIPVFAVLGNHDYECGHIDDLIRILQQAGAKFLGEQTYEVDGVGFAGAKGFGGGFDGRMLGAFGEHAIKAFVNEAVNEALHLENALQTLETERTVVALHYAPIAGTVEGEPRDIYPFMGSSRLAETIDRFKVDAVFHGHAHHGTYKGATPRGIPVYNCARQVQKESGKPYALVQI